MPNPIKYSATSESNSLNVRNWWIGTGDVGKGPTSTTGYYNGITPQSGGYTIYLNKATEGPSIYICANDTELISLTNRIAGASYTTANECFNYYQGQDDKMILNRDIEAIVTDGLVLNLDASLIPSYPRNETTWYDLSGNASNGTLTNGPTFDSENGDSIVFDGVNDYINFDSNSTRTNLGISSYFTFDVWINVDSVGDQFGFPGYAPYWGYTMRTAFTDSNTKLIAHLRYQDNAGVWQDSYNGSSLNKGDIGQWVNFVITFDNGLVTHYVNGNEGTSKTLPLTGQNPTRNLQYGIVGWNYYNGKFSNGRVYNRALTDSEIQQNYNALKGRFGLQ